MVTFYEVKQLLCRLFGHRDIEDNANFPGIVILNLISYIIKLVFSL